MSATAPGRTSLGPHPDRAIIEHEGLSWPHRRPHLPTTSVLATAGEQAGAGRARRATLDSNEVTALGVLTLAVVGFGLYGFAAGAPSTVSYLFTVSAVAALIVRFRDPTLPRIVILGLPLLAIAHLAGGLIRIGNDVLYNASAGLPAFEYDHFVHATGVLLGTIVLWSLFLRPHVDPPRRPKLVAVCVLAGLGLGAVNETIEFLTTLAHSGAHVGGYSNTGWDLVSNVVGGATAAAWLERNERVGRIDRSSPDR